MNQPNTPPDPDLAHAAIAAACRDTLDKYGIGVSDQTVLMGYIQEATEAYDERVNKLVAEASEIGAPPEEVAERQGRLLQFVLAKIDQFSGMAREHLLHGGYDRYFTTGEIFLKS